MIIITQMDLFFCLGVVMPSQISADALVQKEMDSIEVWDWKRANRSAEYLTHDVNF